MPRVVISFDDESGKYDMKRAEKGAERDDMEEGEVLVSVPAAFFKDYYRVSNRGQAHQDKLTSWFNYASSKCVRGVPHFE